MDCRETEKLLSLYLDGEFSDTEKIEIDEHLSGCQRCQIILDEERELKKAIRSIRLQRTPVDLRESIERSISGERRVIAFHNVLKLAGGFGLVALAVVSTAFITHSMTGKRTATPELCVARNDTPAIKTLAPAESRTYSLHKSPLVPVALNKDFATGAQGAGVALKMKTGMRTSRNTHRVRLSPRMVENLVADYLRPLPVEFKDKDPGSAAQWYGGKTGLYAPPPKFINHGGRMVGGRMSRFNGGDAVQLIYSIKGKRVTLFMFNPKMMPGITHVKGAAALTARDASDIIMSTPGGRVVALFAHKGIGYSVISDQDEKTMFALVQSIVRQ
ncbi:zf-HC2 domain-containing protein [Myxococcota bacterium]|nr:zf-HC2 domain-containing protein [Myxococcota bacterium]MBU1536729.1 zf-HC2 domain-containing protein [Myxococcota bacterium]